MTTCPHVRKRGAPTAAKDVPLRDAEMLADTLHVRDQRPRVIVVQAGMRQTAARPALVNKHNAEERGVKKAPVLCRTAAAGTAVPAFVYVCVKVRANKKQRNKERRKKGGKKEENSITVQRNPETAVENKPDGHRCIYMQH